MHERGECKDMQAFVSPETEYSRGLSINPRRFSVTVIL